MVYNNIIQYVGSTGKIYSKYFYLTPFVPLSNQPLISPPEDYQVGEGEGFGEGL
jgi:hypothetical protein